MAYDVNSTIKLTDSVKDQLRERCTNHGEKFLTRLEEHINQTATIVFSSIDLIAVCFEGLGNRFFIRKSDIETST